MKIARVLLVVVPLAASFACGGRVSGSADGGGGSSSSGSSSGSVGDDTDAEPACPSPAVIEPGQACSTPGNLCPSEVTVACPNGGGPSQPLSLFCDQGVWTSRFVSCPDQPPPAEVCPVAGTISEGGACDVDGALSCPSSMTEPTCDGGIGPVVSCTCIRGTWACAMGGVACPDGGGECPPPGDIHTGGVCSPSGDKCPGNPTICSGGVVLYDAFECDAGAWRDVAHTVCDEDAGGG